MARIYMTQTFVTTASGHSVPVHSGGAMKIETTMQEVKPKKVLQTITLIEPDDYIINQTMGGRETVYFFDQVNWEKVLADFPHAGEVIQREYLASI